ncbi:MAG: pitrilysin family protein [Geobacteraceae bacterium]
MISCHTRTLSNGLRLVAVEMPHLHSAEIAVYIKVGGRNDPPDKAGLSHFLEHMLFRGTAEFQTSLALETAFESIGGSVNAATDEESTCFFSRVHPSFVAESVRLFASMMLRPILAGIDLEKRIITEEALEDINEQGEEINPHNLASRLLWPNHPLGMPTIGFLPTIGSFTEADLRQHLANYYVPTNAVLVVVGEIKAEEVYSSCAAEYHGWQGQKAPLQLSPVNPQLRPQSIFVKDSDSQVHLLVNFRGFARNDHRIMATRLLRRILCGSGSSRLHLALRERLGIVYSVDAAISAYEETGSFAIELSTSPKNLPQAVAEVLAATGLLASEPVPQEELQRIKQGYFFDLEFSRDSTYEMQVRYGWGELMGLARRLDDDRDEADALDSAALQTTAVELFAPANLNLVLVGPWEAKGRRKVDKIVADYEKKWSSISRSDQESVS